MNILDICKSSIPCLLIDELNTEFDNELTKVISDDDVPHADEEKPEKEPTHTPENYDSYIILGISLLRGMYGELYHSKVKSCAVDKYGIPVALKIINQSLIHDSMT